jgi:4-alpha-glucanotransferase
VNELLLRLALYHGLTVSYADAFGGGHEQAVPEETLRVILGALGVDIEAEPYGEPAERRMWVPSDARCWLPPSLEQAKGWGVFCQLYELRSERNWGIGDFADLAALAEICGEAGADFLGVNPLHALFLSDPNKRSPFFPSNRRFLNPLYIAPDLVTGVVEPEAVRTLRKAELIDYPTIASAKIGALRSVFDAAGIIDGLDAFAAAGGEAMRLHAVFEAISAQMVAEGRTAGWQGWPETLRDPRGYEVEKLADALKLDVSFHLWLQMIARGQLADASAAARRGGMRIGLYLDLAVGEAPDGSSTWSRTAATLPNLTVGAPPDMFAAEGQNWGLTAPSPTAMEEAGFTPFREVILAQVRDCGALRIDHAMALWQLYLIPEGASAMAGAHLRYPFTELLRVLSDVSNEHQTVVVGEDLGFVPDGLREAMMDANVLSYRILVFEQDANGFKDLGSYPKKSFACLSTHDLPVLSAWWRGEDVEHRLAYGLVTEEQALLETIHRGDERKALVRLLMQSGLLNYEVNVQAAELPDGILNATYRFLASTSSLLAGVRLADLVGPVVATNVPGTAEQYPNWRPRSPLDLALIRHHPAFVATANLMREMRPRPNENPQ